MKADIPDKILINRDEDGKIHHSYWTTDQQLIPFEDVEYIRKDALLEWAKKHQEGERQGSYTWSCYQIFIDKLNEM